MKEKYQFQIALPFYHGVIFVDWHGVLCDKMFWHSILSKQSHRLHTRLKAKSEVLFRTKKEIVRDWMRGELNSQEVLRELGIQLPKQYSNKYLHRKLYRDCRETGFDAELLEFLQNFRSRYFVVLATDNMDCFFESLEQIKGLLDGVDFVLCSSELGVLKSDGVQKFFGPWLEAHRLNFKQAVLIDDSEDTCLAFREAGGISVLYRGVVDVKNALSAQSF